MAYLMKQYEVAMMKHVEGSVEDNFESISFEDAENYRDAVHIAKSMSMKWDACDVICYCDTLETSYWQIFRETYIKGKKYTEHCFNICISHSFSAYLYMQKGIA